MRSVALCGALVGTVATLVLLDDCAEETIGLGVAVLSVIAIGFVPMFAIFATGCAFAFAGVLFAVGVLPVVGSDLAGDC